MASEAHAPRFSLVTDDDVVAMLTRAQPRKSRAASA